ncbi:MAG: 50S ribosomal protein L24 [Rhodobacteraceae bacterium]|nr:50S ribosomal protein L24 [Paracoccaceae bacterium]MCY4195744.1 50S ribosomal protein L24 [Paracoccaceae bacterium]MCY4327876.1 50S ribosomal protein L24 [Paracoccaceae bacterium]
MAAKLKSGDRVVVISGRDKGAQGVIRSVDTRRGRAIVTDVAVTLRHVKPRSGQKGERRAEENSVDLSNLMLVDPTTSQRTRVGFRIQEGKKVRFSKSTGEVIDG